MLVFPHWRQEFPNGGCRVPQWMPVDRFAPYLARPVPLPPLPPQLEDDDTSGGSSPERTDECDGVCGWRGCGAGFQNVARLSAHVARTHAHAHSDGVFYCGWKGCARPQRGFNARYKMLVHVRTHTNERPHTCEQCQKSFSRAENLKIHMRSHSGEKPYVCPYEGCGKAYSNSSDRFKHTRTHAVEKPYCCKMAGCNKRYTDPSSLRKHVKTYKHFTTKQTRRESSDSDTLSPKEFERTSPIHTRNIYERTSPIHARIVHERTSPIHARMVHEHTSPIHARIIHDRTSPIHPRILKERTSPMHASMRQEPTSPIHTKMVQEPTSPIHPRIVQERTSPIHVRMVQEHTSPIYARMVQAQTSPNPTLMVHERTSPIHETIIPERISPIHARMVDPLSLSPTVKIENPIRYSPIEQVTYIRPKPMYPVRAPTDEMSYIEYSQMYEQAYRNYYSSMRYPVLRPTICEKVPREETQEDMSFIRDEEGYHEEKPLNLICNKRLECRPIEDLVRRTDLPLDLSTKS